MKQNEKSGNLSAQVTAVKNKQIEMTVDGCIVKINFIPNQNKTTKIEAVKKMMLSGLAKA